jgi:protein HIRA/HIR1
MNSWLRISDAWFIISEFWGSGSSTIEQHPLGWLSTALRMTGSRDSTHESIMVLARIDPDVSSAVTISHIEVRHKKEPQKMLQVIDATFWIVKVHALTQSR